MGAHWCSGSCICSRCTLLDSSTGQDLQLGSKILLPTSGWRTQFWICRLDWSTWPAHRLNLKLRRSCSNMAWSAHCSHLLLRISCTAYRLQCLPSMHWTLQLHGMLAMEQSEDV